MNSTVGRLAGRQRQSGTPPDFAAEISGHQLWLDFADCYIFGRDVRTQFLLQPFLFFFFSFFSFFSTICFVCLFFVCLTFTPPLTLIRVLMVLGQHTYQILSRRLGGLGGLGMQLKAARHGFDVLILALSTG